jgi:hypothetical protein
MLVATEHLVYSLLSQYRDVCRWASSVTDYKFSSPPSWRLESALSSIVLCREVISVVRSENCYLVLLE